MFSPKTEEEPSSDNAVMFEFAAKNTTASGGKVFSKLFKWIPIENQTFPVRFATGKYFPT